MCNVDNLDIEYQELMVDSNQFINYLLLTIAEASAGVWGWR